MEEENLNNINSKLKSKLASTLNINKSKRPLDDSTNLNKMRKFQSSSRLPISSSSNHEEMNRFRQLINDKTLEIENIKINSISLRNEIESQNLENYRIDSNFQNLEITLNDLNLKINELMGYKEQSLISLSKKYELEQKRLNMNHQEKLNDIKEEITKKVDDLLTKKQEKYEKEINELTKEINEMMESKVKVEADMDKKLILLKENHHTKESSMIGELQDECDKSKTEIETITQEIIVKTNQIDDIKLNKFTQLEKEHARFMNLLEQLKIKNNHKQNEIDNLENQISNKKSKVKSLHQSSEERSEELKRLNFEIARMKSELINQETKRRKLHGKLQDLKGNIRVFCRIRNATSSDLVKYQIPQDINDESKQDLLITKTNNNNNTNNATYRFSFDKIFPPEHTNDMIFDELSQLIQCSLDGTNVCVFAYGQTGSGKTFTMSHPQNGMIPLSIMKIFQDIDDLKEKGWSYSIFGKFIEIYNESIIDLLNPTNSMKHEIKHDDSVNKTTVTNITTIEITSPNQAHEILTMANKKRSTAATKSNDHSSRSHSIFIIELQGDNSITGESSNGILNLIDLAGI
ncbi:hypothetical protein CTRG_01872 [Candida tropicalis MYA-3404]|uniref:Kinesin motor domain-containing protein n=1 Tax=Candida tropicalis (strain ATCC MYA-3404 / T1) TaxID=294747 RepID=C5M7P0_CANTT|nr:hypothetical protein CTRG_01872 [Candida tropicalis MYA-3404]EER35010.1 hypothetical protein CTRG_01872 [Candida tropicalis MYA-3404]KAG4408895.1 hypothetical protein JTP64_002201 [Candida tropicalis]